MCPHNQLTHFATSKRLQSFPRLYCLFDHADVKDGDRRATQMVCYTRIVRRATPTRCLAHRVLLSADMSCDLVVSCAHVVRSHRADSTSKEQKRRDRRRCNVRAALETRWRPPYMRGHHCNTTPVVRCDTYGIWSPMAGDGVNILRSPRNASKQQTDRQAAARTKHIASDRRARRVQRNFSDVSHLHGKTSGRRTFRYVRHLHLPLDSSQVKGAEALPCDRTTGGRETSF